MQSSINLIRSLKNEERPIIGLKWAQTLDGQMADDFGKSKWISGDEELVFTHQLRSAYDAVLVGARTFLNDLSQLTVRHIKTKEGFLQPVRVILDPRNVLAVGRLEERVLESLSNDSRPTVLMASGEFSTELPSNVIRLDISGVFEKDLGVSLLQKVLMDRLGRECKRIMIEGGPSTLKLFIEKEIADIAHISIAPKLTGGHCNRIATNRSLDFAYQFELHNSFSKGQDTVLELIHPGLKEKVNEAS